MDGYYFSMWHLFPALSCAAGPFKRAYYEAAEALDLYGNILIFIAEGVCADEPKSRQIYTDFRETFLGAFASLRKASDSFFISVRLSAYNNSAPTGRIFMKFDV